MDNKGKVTKILLKKIIKNLVEIAKKWSKQ